MGTVEQGATEAGQIFDMLLIGHQRHDENLVKKQEAVTPSPTNKFSFAKTKQFSWVNIHIDRGFAAKCLYCPE